MGSRFYFHNPSARFYPAHARILMMLRQLALLSVILVLLLVGPGVVWAQTAEPSPSGTAQFTAVDVNSFPEVHAYLQVQDAAGGHIAGLGPEAFAVTENSTAVASVAVLEAELGVQVVFVLEASAAFKTRDVNGLSRLDYAREALEGFLEAGLSQADDLTLVGSEGLLVAHVSSAAPVRDALSRYAPEFTGSADPYALLNSGLNFAADVPPRPGMRRVLIYLSNGLPGTAGALEDVAARAQAAQIQIHTVFVGPDGALDTAGAQALRQLAEQTGGLDLFLRAPAALDPVFKILSQQRQQYRLTYRSAVNLTGQHTLAARLTLPTGATLPAPSVMFQMRVEPPQVNVPNPPARLSLAEVGAEYPLPVQVLFPDGHPRQLRMMELVVDGQPVDARTAGEVSAVVWPLAGYTTSLTRTVQIRVTDELGLSAASKPVEVFVEALPVVVAAAQPAGQPPGLELIVMVLAGVGVVAAGAGGGLWWYWRRRGAPDRSVSVSAPRPAPFDPKQTLPLPAVAPTRRRHLPRLHFASRGARVKRLGPAYLEVVEAGGGGAQGDEIELVGPRLRVGRDPQVAEVVFPDRSVSRLHARIEATGPGAFRIYDEGSTSGTWVNFVQVEPAAGQELHHGDLINLGRVQLRFKARPPQGSNGASADSVDEKRV